jgi:hypothetical protein
MPDRDSLWVDAGGKVTVRTVNEDNVPVEIPAEFLGEFEKRKDELRGIPGERKPGPEEAKRLVEEAARAPRPFNPGADQPFAGKGDHDKNGKTGGTAHQKTTTTAKGGKAA